MQSETAVDVSLGGGASVFDLFEMRARMAPGAIALNDLSRTLTYGELRDRALRLAAAFRDLGLERGDRIAILSENRFEYVETQLAAAALGLIVACQNWRLAKAELTHCLNLVEPRLVICSQRFRPAFDAAGLSVPVWNMGDEYEEAIRRASPLANRPAVHGEDGLLILYTSGTTGLPKGALISHRAEVARGAVCRMDFALRPDDGFLAWAPMYHMGSADQTLGALMNGATAHVIDGLDPDRMVRIMADHPLGWTLLMPGAIEQVSEALRRNNITPRRMVTTGAMLDMVPRAQAREICELTRSPYMNGFGSTETGVPPLSTRLMPVEELDGPISKWPSSLTDIRLVDPDGGDVPDGEPGEMSVRGPTVFSGYWNAPEATAKDFAGGRFRMGDMFIRNPDGAYDFVDRAKYLIKSGGENIYPREIERVLLTDPRIRDAVVVRRADDQWGEVPVALVARQADDLTAADIEALCRAELAGYKRPKAVRFIDYDDLPRNTTGKIVRYEVEAMLERMEAKT